MRHLILMIGLAAYFVPQAHASDPPREKPFTMHCSRDKDGKFLGCWYSDGCNTCTTDDRGNTISCTLLACTGPAWPPPCDPKPGETCTGPEGHQ